MLVILEGQARTGKTSICAALAEQLELAGCQVERYKSKERSDNPFLKLLEVIVPMAFDDSKIYIVDRCHMTEVVYSIVTGRDIKYPPVAMGYVDGILGLGKTILVFAIATIETLERRASETGRESEGDVVRIAELYMNCLQMTKIQHVRIADTEAFTPTQIAQKLVEDIKTTLFEGEYYYGFDTGVVDAIYTITDKDSA